MSKLVLFSASKDQYKYFSSLVAHVDLPVALKSYKALWKFSLRVELPTKEINNEVNVLVRRKKNSRQGQSKSSLYWYIFRWLNLQKAKLLYRQYQAWLKYEPAGYIGVWNGKKFRQALLVIAAKKLSKNILYFETGPLPGYSVIDPVGVDYWSAIPRDAGFYLSRSIKHDSFTSMQFESERPETLPEYFIFVPFQVVEDSNIYLHSPWIKDMRQLYQVLVDAADSNPKINFVVKPHPACPEIYDDLEKTNHPQIQFIKNITSQTLVNHADAVLTVNSTVGMEAIIARKKVVVLGKAIYGFAPLTKSVTNQSELNQVLASLNEWVLDSVLIEHYLDYLVTDYAVPGDAMASPTKEHWSCVQRKLSMMLEGDELKAIGISKEDLCTG